MNVGTAEGTFNLRGLKESIRDLRRSKTELERLDRAVTNHIQNNRKFVAALKRKGAVHASVLRDAKGTRQAHKMIVRAIRERVAALAVLRKSQRQLIALNVKGAVKRQIKVFRELLRVQRKLAAASIKGGIGRMLQFRPSQTKAFGQVTKSFQQFGTAIKNNNAGMKTWWSRFGGVAAGFWIAYRAINAFEFVLSRLTRTFFSGVTMVDEYRQSVATVAGMLALINNKTGTFATQFTRFQAVMQDTMRESIRLAPKYRLSIDEIGNAFKELSQFGVIVARQQVDNTLNAIAMIREIAATTGSTARQVRQEIQALFTGTTRVTDQFGRMIKQSMPELAKTIFGVAAANTTNAEKWQLVIKRMSSFQSAVEATNQTVSAQVEILTKNLQIISSFAVDTSGIYDEWVEKIKAFNAELFTATGELAPFGERIFRAFFRVWQIIDKSVKALNMFWQFARDLFHIIVGWLAPFKSFLMMMLKWAVIIGAVKFAYSTLLGIMKTIVTLTGIGLVIKLVAIFKSLRLVIIAASIPMLKFVAIMAAIIAVFVAGVAWGKKLSAMFHGLGSGIGAFIGVISVPLESFFSRQFSNLKTWFDAWKKGFTTDDFEPPTYLPPKDFFAGKGKEAADAFSEAYQTAHDESMGRFKEGLEGLADLVSDVLSPIADSIKALFIDLITPETGSALDDILKNLKANLIDLTTFDDIKLPDFTEWSGSVDTSVDSARSSLDKMLDDLKSMASYVDGEFKRVFTDVFQGEITSFAEFWDATLNAMVNSFQKAMADLTQAYFKNFLEQTFLSENLPGIVKGFLGGAGAFGPSASFLAAGTAAGQFGGAGQATIGLAGGGVIAEPVFGIGASGQTYTLAERGPERVLSNADSFAKPQAPSVVVNVINKTSREVDATQGNVSFDGKKFIVETIIKDVDQGGDLRSLFQGR